MWTRIYIAIGALLLGGYFWIARTGKEPFSSSKRVSVQDARDEYQYSGGHSRGGWFYFGGGGK